MENSTYNRPAPPYGLGLPIFTGSMTAIVTPFKNGKVDETALRNLIEWQIKEGTSAIVPCGTTGESATITEQEREKIIKTCVEQSSGRVAVIAGSGSNCTETAIKFARIAKDFGADAQLQVTPYYNKPTQEGLFQHFKTIASIVDLPMILYNVPGRSAVNMLPKTVARLSQIETIVGIKEACGSLDQIKELISSVPDNFVVLSGEDSQNLEIYELGGKGCISVTANILPDKVSRIWKLHKGSKHAEAKKLQEEIEVINKMMFIETNPIPVKTALSMMGKIHEEFRLPLTPMGEENREKLRGVLNSAS